MCWNLPGRAQTVLDTPLGWVMLETDSTERKGLKQMICRKSNEHRINGETKSYTVTEVWHYDKAGRLLQVTQQYKKYPISTFCRLEYDSLGRLWRIYDGYNRIGMQYFYGSDGRRSHAVESRGRACILKTYSYDSETNVERVYEYELHRYPDPAGKRIISSRPDTTFVPCPLYEAEELPAETGLLASERIFSPAGELLETRDYNDGKLCFGINSSWDATGTIKYTWYYDDDQRELSEEKIYNARGQVTQRRWFLMDIKDGKIFGGPREGWVNTFSYDKKGRLSRAEHTTPYQEVAWEYEYVEW
ncbi:MAG: hypothetical protein DYG98_04135 [Haliscomenobacteraceae bacterium CHB4]|nr:hypothetical protein [Haliscomenobacteraceae bacterium CHB4]